MFQVPGGAIQRVGNVRSPSGYIRLQEYHPRAWPVGKPQEVCNPSTLFCSLTFVVQIQGRAPTRPPFFIPGRGKVRIRLAYFDGSSGMYILSLHVAVGLILFSSTIIQLRRESHMIGLEPVQQFIYVVCVLIYTQWWTSVQN